MVNNNNNNLKKKEYNNNNNNNNNPNLQNKKSGSVEWAKWVIAAVTISPYNNKIIIIVIVK